MNTAVGQIAVYMPLLANEKSQNARGISSLFNRWA